MKKIALELEESLYESVEKEVKKSYEGKWKADLIWLLFMALVYGWIAWLLYLTPNPYWVNWSKMCDYMVMYEDSYDIVRVNSNPTSGEMTSVLNWNPTSIRQLTCDWERDD